MKRYGANRGWVREVGTSVKKIAPGSTTTSVGVVGPVTRGWSSCLDLEGGIVLCLERWASGEMEVGKRSQRRPVGRREEKQKVTSERGPGG